MPEDAIRILLEVDVADESLTGRASAGDGAVRTFTGWLGLVSALDALLPASHPRIREPDALTRAANPRAEIGSYAPNNKTRSWP